jgi:hypothetical protein
MDQIGSGKSTAVLRPEYCRDGGFRGGAIAGDCELAILQHHLVKQKHRDEV